MLFFLSLFYIQYRSTLVSAQWKVKLLRMSRVSSFHIFSLTPLLNRFDFSFLSVCSTLIDCLGKYQSTRGNVNFNLWNVSSEERKKTSKSRNVSNRMIMQLAEQLAEPVIMVCQPLFVDLFFLLSIVEKCRL